MSDNHIFHAYQSTYKESLEEELDFQEYLELCKNNPLAYANHAERMLEAIGSAREIDTKQDRVLAQIFQNRIIKIYEPFIDLYGMEDVIEQIVGFFKHAGQGLEAKKQVLYLLGPVGGGKSSIAEKMKNLMEKIPFYALKGSPVHDSPLSLFTGKDELIQKIEERYNIPKRYFSYILSPWAVKRLKEFNGDISKFKVVKIRPSKLHQIAIAKTEPGDENNQDISSLVGKIDIRRLEEFSQNDPDAYSFSGGLGLANRGLLEFVEMFKAPIKTLHPLLTATQEGNYNTTEGLPVPFEGTILAHSNEAEWQKFRNDRNNEAFIDRIYIVKVPYCLRVSEEIKIYQKLIDNSSLKKAPCAPGTLEMMAQFSVLTRLKEPENSNIYSKMRVYNGENLKDTDPKAKSYQEYKDFAGVDEGMTGLSTRFAFKILSKVFNFDHTEIAANPVHLLYVLERQLLQEQFPQEIAQKYLNFIKEYITPKYVEFIGKEIQTAYLESYSEYGQNIFDRYVTFADFWIQDQDYRDPDTGEIFDRAALNEELEQIEKPAGISNPKDFRNEIVNFVLRARANNHGKNPAWYSYEKLKSVIEKKMFSNTEELLPVISFNPKASAEQKQKHEDFINRMVEKGYTSKQVRLLSDWYLRVRKSQ